MAEVVDLQVTDSANGTRTDALWPEGMPMSGVNDGGRADEGIIARWEKDINTSRLSTGSGSAYIVSVNRNLPGTFPANFYDGLEIGFRPHVTNAAAATVGVGGAENNAPLQLPNGENLPANCFTAGVPVKIIWNSTNTAWTVVSFCSIFQGNDVIAPQLTARSASTPIVEGDRTAFSAGFQNMLSLAGYALNAASSKTNAAAITLVMEDSTTGAEIGQCKISLAEGGGALVDSFIFTSAAIRAATASTKDLGTAAVPFKDLYLSGSGGGAAQILVDGDLEIITSGGSLTVNGTAVP